MAASFIFGIGCLLMPAFAMVINFKFSFLIPFTETPYKPWRLYVLMCGLPSLISWLAVLNFPESPKFTLKQGKQSETIEIIKTVYSINTGKNKNDLNIISILDETTSIKSKYLKDSKNIFKSMWKQTAPIFMQPYLRNTIIACILQFGILSTANGMYIWFPYIVNKVAMFTEANPSSRTRICDIIMSSKSSNSSASTDCSEILDMSTFEIEFIFEFIYLVGFFLLGLLINVIGKITILIIILIGCGIFGIITVFVDIPIVSIYLFIILLLVGLAVTVVNAVSVDLYPTHLRAMAVCITLMFGRIGSVFGANMGAVLLETYCLTTFFISGISLIGKFYKLIDLIDKT